MGLWEDIWTLRESRRIPKQWKRADIRLYLREKYADSHITTTPSNESLVRVDASKKQLAMTLFFNHWDCGSLFMSLARDTISSSWGRVRSDMEIMFLLNKGLVMANSCGSRSMGM